MRKREFLAIVGFVIVFSFFTAEMELGRLGGFFKFNTFSVTGSPWHNAMLKFADIVKAQTKGEIEILVYADAQLGDMTQSLTGMRTGSLDMAYFDCGVASFLKEYQAMQIAWCLYLPFKSKKDASRIMNSPMIFDYIKAPRHQEVGSPDLAIARGQVPEGYQYDQRTHHEAR